MPTCYILIGPQGCGKSTWREANLVALNDPVQISTDDMFDEVAAQDGITYAEAWINYSYDDMVKRANALIMRAVIAQRDIIIDQTNCTVVSRQLFRRLIPADYRIVGVQFAFDYKQIISRVVARGKRTGKVIPVGAVVEKMKSFEPCAEGEFDEVILVPLA